MMNDFRFSRRSRAELSGVHVDLVVLVTVALIESEIDFTVMDGRRTEAEQHAFIAAGVSWTMDSRHLTGHAVDLVPVIAGRTSWDSHQAFREVGAAMRRASLRLGIPFVWGALRKYGGDWTTRNDMAHFELPRERYPAIRQPGELTYALTDSWRTPPVT